jgi:hypothetical protein
MEMAHLLRSCGGQLDWVRFEAVVARYGMGWIAAPLLGLVRDETGAPMPAGLVERVWRNAMPGKALELSFRRLPPEQRGPWQKFFLRFFETLRSQLHQGFSWWRLLIHPAPIFRAFADSEVEFPFLKDTIFKRIWTRRATNNIPVGDRGISFVQGFSFPEQGGRWTDAEFAVIEVAADAPQHASIKTELNIVPFLPPGVSVFKFEIYAGIGDLKRCELTFRDPMPFCLAVDALVVDRVAQKVVIVLRMLNLMSPIEIGHSSDPRLLGLFIESVRNIPVAARAEGDARQ